FDQLGDSLKGQGWGLFIIELEVIRVLRAVYFDGRPVAAFRALREDYNSGIIPANVFAGEKRGAMYQLFFVISSSFTCPVQEDDQRVRLVAVIPLGKQDAIR